MIFYLKLTLYKNIKSPHKYDNWITKINTLPKPKSRNLPQGSLQCTHRNPQVFVDLFKHSDKLIMIIKVVCKYSVFMQCIVPK